MEEIRLGEILKEAWRSAWSNFFVWLGGLILVELPLAGLLVFMDASLSWLPYWPLLFLFLMALALTFAFAYIHKFAFITIRYPKWVRKNFLRSVWYSITDDFLNRMIYSFLLVVILILIYYTGLAMSGFFLALLTLFTFALAAGGAIIVPFIILLFPLLLLGVQFFFAYLVSSHLFLLPYIVQVTGSADNRAKPLTFVGCFSKSVTGIDGYRWTYAWLSSVLLLLGLVGLAAFNLLTGLLAVTGSVSWTGDFLGSLFVPLLFLILGIFILIFILAARTVFANALMEGDPEIADFGD